MSGPSYRDSHLAKGVDYHETFSSLPHRAMLWELEKRLLVRLVSGMFPNQEATYLDFACGTGRILAHMHPMVRSTTGVDVSASMLEVARDALPGVNLIEADLTHEDRLGGKQFDLITAFRFFPNAEPALRTEVARVLALHLAPAGRLIFNNHKNSSSLMRRLALARGRVPAIEGETGTARTMSRAEVRELVAGAGLHIEREIPLAVLPFTDRHMLRPAGLLRVLESGLSHLPLAARIAQDLVYVCRHAPADAPRPPAPQ